MREEYNNLKRHELNHLLYLELISSEMLDYDKMRKLIKNGADLNYVSSVIKGLHQKVIDVIEELNNE